jgi:hypothetical protein
LRERYDFQGKINTGTYTRTVRARAPARFDSMQVLVIFVPGGSNGHSNAHSNGASVWVPSGPSNTFPLSALDHAIFNYIQS